LGTVERPLGLILSFDRKDDEKFLLSFLLELDFVKEKLSFFLVE
jgi:hypothetical protein